MHNGTVHIGVTSCQHQLVAAAKCHCCPCIHIRLRQCPADNHPYCGTAEQVDFRPVSGQARLVVLLHAVGWVALVVALILGFIKLTWWWGTSKKHNYTKLNEVRC